MDAKLHALTTEEFVETDTRMQLATAMAWMTSMIALVIGAIGTLNTMMTSVLERTQRDWHLAGDRLATPPSGDDDSVGVMRLGVDCLRVGCVLAALLTWALSQASAAKGILSPAIDAHVILQGFLLALGIGLLGMILACRADAPTEAFRNCGWIPVAGFLGLHNSHVFRVTLGKDHR